MTQNCAVVDWLPIKAIASELSLHDSQIRRDRAVLSELGIITYTRKGMRIEDFECLKLFRQLISERGRGEAISIIEEKWHERAR